MLVDSKEQEFCGIKAVTDKDHAGEYIRNNWIDEVYISVEDFSLLPTELIVQCCEMAVTVHQQMFKNANLKGEQTVEKIAKQTVLTTSIRVPKPRSLIIKRAIDIVETDDRIKNSVGTNRIPSLGEVYGKSITVMWMVTGVGSKSWVYRDASRW